MAAPAVTHTFVNGTTADATQVNTNFTDIINSLTDGTKDLTISAITAGGTATFNGNVSLGNASGDDLTITASLASSIAIKTQFSYDIGASALGIKSIYFGSDDSAAFGVRVIGGTMGASWTFTLPESAGTSRYVLETNGSGVSSWQPRKQSSFEVSNYAIAATVGSSALTVSLKGADNNDPSSTNIVDAVFRDPTAATGTPVARQITSAMSVTASSGSTLGTEDGVTAYLYVYLVYYAGGPGVDLGLSKTHYDDGTLLTTTAEGGAGGADSPALLYTTTARTSASVRCIGRLKVNESTAGTWASGPSEVSLLPFTERIHTRTLSGSETTGISTNTWVSLNSNSMVLPPGVWLLTGMADALGSGTVERFICAWGSANGADSGSQPAATIGSLSPASQNFIDFFASSVAAIRIPAPSIIVEVADNTTLTIYLNTYVTFTTGVSLAVYGTATRIR